MIQRKTLASEEASYNNDLAASAAEVRSCSDGQLFMGCLPMSFTTRYDVPQSKLAKSSKPLAISPEAGSSSTRESPSPKISLRPVK